MTIHNPKNCFVSSTEVDFHSSCNLEDPRVTYDNKAREFVQFAMFYMRLASNIKQNAFSTEEFLGRFTFSPSFPVKLFASLQIHNLHQENHHFFYFVLNSFSPEILEVLKG